MSTTVPLSFKTNSRLSALAPEWRPSARPTTRQRAYYTAAELLKTRANVDPNFVPAALSDCNHLMILAGSLSSSSLSSSLASSSLSVSLRSAGSSPVAAKSNLPKQLDWRASTGQAAQDGYLTTVPQREGEYTVERCKHVEDDTDVAIPQALILLDQSSGQRYRVGFDDPAWKALPWQCDARGRPYSAIMLYMVSKENKAKMIVRVEPADIFRSNAPMRYYLDSESLIRTPWDDRRADAGFADLPLGLYEGANLYLHRTGGRKRDAKCLSLSRRNPYDGGRIFCAPLTSDLFLGVRAKVPHVKHPLTILASKGIKECTLKICYAMDGQDVYSRKVLVLS